MRKNLNTRDQFAAIQLTHALGNGFVCAWCGISPSPGKHPRDHGPTTAEWDHIHPVSRGGSNTPGNVVLSCRRCNSGRCNGLREPWEIAHIAETSARLFGYDRRTAWEVLGYGSDVCECGGTAYPDECGMCDACWSQAIAETRAA